MTEKQYNLGKTIKKVKIMTEKRFRLTNLENKLCDMDYGINDINKILTFTEVVKLLNELHDENEQLKQQNDRQAKQLSRLYHLIEEKKMKNRNLYI